MDKNIIDYIKHQKWFFGVRAEASLFMYSAKYWNREKLNNQEYKSEFIETLLFPKKANCPVRVFNLEQAKKFHAESKDKILKNPNILSGYIKKEADIWGEIENLSKAFRKIVKWKKTGVLALKEDFSKVEEIFKKLLELYGEVGNLFFINFSLGKELTANQDKIKRDISEIILEHDKWRNSVVFKEEKLGEIFYYFIKLLIQEKNVDANPLEIIKYISAREIIEYLSDEKINIKDPLKERKENGYVFVYFHDNQEVISNNMEVKKISEYFLNIENNRQKNQQKELKGQVTFKPDGIIEGKVIIVKDKNELENLSNKDFTGKILVAIQTTPHFIPYLKEIKAIITDEGGITCHAAIISREMKIPCIVGTGKATEILKNGDRIEIDKEGSITILK